MKLDLATAYAASFTRVASWAVVAGLVYRYGGALELSLLMLARGTVGFLTYASLGLTPALIGRFVAPMRVIPVEPREPDRSLDYAPPAISSRPPVAERQEVYGAALVGVFVIAVLCIPLAQIYGEYFGSIHRIARFPAERGGSVAITLAIGVLARAWSDVPAAWLAANRKQALDNLLVITCDILFVGLVLLNARPFHPAEPAASAFVISSVLLALLRWLAAGPFTALISVRRIVPLLLPLFGSGALVLLSQLVDWLYAPFNQILISRTIGVAHVATYAPAIQIDGAMLLLVSGLASVLLPKTAIAHADRDVARIRMYYIRGTLVSLAVLAAGAVAILACEDLIFRLWFNDPMTATQAILPLVLVHTVIGGASSVGRSVLFGIGRIKAYAIAALVGGVGNALLAVVLVTLTDWGLKGIVIATIVTVVVRCAIWMPWYTLRTLRPAPGSTTT